MKRTLVVTLTLCVALSVTTLASAVPFISAVATDLGGGLIAWDVFFEGNDGLNASAAVDLKFSGAINQVPTTTASLTTTTLTDFTTYEFLGPDPVGDSYLYIGSVASAFIPFTATGVWNTPLPSGIGDHPTGTGYSSDGVDGSPMWMSMGVDPILTPGGINVAQVAHIVIDSNLDGGLGELTLEGRFSRGGVVTDLPEGGQIFQIPEPSTIIMLGMGAFALVGLGLRRRNRA